MEKGFIKAEVINYKTLLVPDHYQSPAKKE